MKSFNYWLIFQKFQLLLADLPFQPNIERWKMLSKQKGLDKVGSWLKFSSAGKKDKQAYLILRADSFTRMFVLLWFCSLLLMLILIEFFLDDLQVDWPWLCERIGRKQCLFLLCGYNAVFSSRVLHKWRVISVLVSHIILNL